jgi:hypothetical protein
MLSANALSAEILDGGDLTVYVGTVYVVSKCFIYGLLAFLLLLGLRHFYCFLD